MDSPENLTQMDFWNELEETDVSQSRRRRERCTCGAWKCSGRGGMTSEKERERALQRATKKGDAEQVAALLKGAGCWPDRLLEKALKMASSEDVVRVFASAVPNFFWERQGGANALLSAADNGRTKLLHSLLATGVAADATASDQRAKALPAACAKGHVACVEMLLEHGADPKQCVEGNTTMLHLAADGGETACVSVLLRWGAELQATDVNGLTPLHWTAWKGHCQCMSTLLDAGADPNAADQEKNTPLHCASRIQLYYVMQYRYRLSPASLQSAPSNYVACVKELLRRGADVNAVNDESYTPLSCAIADDNVEIARFLIDNGADLQHRVRNGRSVVYHAVTSRYTVNCLLELLKRPDVPHIDTPDDLGDTPLLAAVKSINVKGVEELLRFGADTEARDAEGFCALHRATQSHFWDAVKLLLQAGADVHATATDDRLTILHLAAGLTNEKVLVALLERGLDINARAANGRTPLHIAPHIWSKDFLELLLVHGADMLARDDAGFSVLHCAAEMGATTSVEFLLRRGFPVDDVTNDGRTALHVAARASRENCVRALLLVGANRLARDASGDTPADVAVHDHIKQLIRHWSLAG